MSVIIDSFTQRSRSAGVFSCTNQGFSLVELSIVLVILGLLVGGVLSGRSLIRAAQIRSVIAEYQQFNTAVYGFRLHYHALPGDQPDAFRFWGARAGCADSAAGWHTDGCNGNGDGRINEQQESLRAWQFMALAGLVPGVYSGRAADNDSVAHAGVTMPASRLGQGVWHIAAVNSPHVFQFQPYGPLTNSLRLAMPDAGAPDSPAMSPAEAYSIDSKMDDGKPGKGRIVSYNTVYASAPCINDGDNIAAMSSSANPGFNPDSSSYYLQTEAISCVLQFELQ